MGHKEASYSGSVWAAMKEGISRRGFNTVPAIFMIAYHLLLFIGWILYFWNYTPSFGLCIVSIVLLYLTGMSITAGYHRYYAHTTYKTNPVIETLLLFFASMAAQGSALRWSYDHRLHHAYVDSDEDPYSIKKGFWYAHMLWIFEKPRVIQDKVVADLLRNKLVMFQHTHYKFCMIISNLIAFLAVGYFFNDYLGAFVIAWWTRIFVLHHSTWFINSLAHTWGAHTFSKEQTAVDNYMISLLTFGEGYHNYHHTFANDYRNGVRWYHFDPTKWFIWTLNKLGLAYGLKRMSKFHIKEKMVVSQKNELLQAIECSDLPEKEQLLQKANDLSESIIVKLRQNKELVERYKHAKAVKDNAVEGIRREMKQLRHAIREDWKRCQAFAKALTRMPFFRTRA